MLDTIRVKFPIRPTDDQLKAWTKQTTRSTTGEKTKYIYNPVLDETVLRFTYLPADYQYNPMLTVEFSLPKLIFDNNYQMLQSADGAAKVANIQLAAVPHIPKLDLLEGILIRLDICYNHQVGEAVDDYLNALGKLDYPHRRTKYHKHEGVEYKAKHKTTKFYNKEFESGCKEAFGILRQEITMLTGKNVQEFLHKPKPTLLDVSRDLVIAELKDDLKNLGLLNNSIGNQETTLKRLCDEYGEMAGIYYYTFITNRMEKSKKRIAQETKLHPRSLDRRLRKIIDVGIPLTLTDREEPLPPLEINL